MDAKKREIRTIDCRLAVREQAEGHEGESRTITGTAIVFGAESEVLDDWGERFREVIEPSAVTKEFLNTQDVKMNMLHDRGLTVARCNQGKGSLRLEVTPQGVNFEFEAPKCDIGDRCLEMVRRGDYSGCSFEFLPKDYDVERKKGADGVDEVTIRHREFEWLGALTIGMDPAYKQTTVNAREIGLSQSEETAEQKAEREEKPEEKPEDKPEEKPEDKPEEKPEEKSEETDEEREQREAEERRQQEEQEQQERERIAVMHMRRNRARLAGRAIEDMVW